MTLQQLQQLQAQIEQIQSQAPAVPSRDEAIAKLNKELKTAFGFAISNPLLQAAVYAIGASLNNGPIHKGAIMALAGGPLTGFAAGLAIQQFIPRLREKTYDSSYFMVRNLPAMMNYLLENAAMFSTMPLGATLVPFKTQAPVSQLIIDQLIGSAVILAAVVALAVLAITIIYCSVDAADRRAENRMIADAFRMVTAIDIAPIMMAEATLVEPITATVRTNVETGQLHHTLPQAQPVGQPNQTVATAMAATTQAIPVARLERYQPPAVNLGASNNKV